MSLLTKDIYGLSECHSVTLTSFDNSNNRVKQPRKPYQFNSFAEDSLQRCYQPNIDGSCPIHRCINWLSENKSCVTKLPSDIVSDYQKREKPVDIVTVKKSKNLNFQNVLVLLKSKLRYKYSPQKTLESVRQQKEENKKKMKPTDFFGSKKKLLVVKLNYNTNKPCCNSNTAKVKAHELNPENIPKFIHNHLTRSYTHDVFDEDYTRNTHSSRIYSTDTLETSTFSTPGDTSGMKKLRQSKIISDDNSSDEESQSRDNSIILNHFSKKIRNNDVIEVFDGETLCVFLENLAKKYSRKRLYPKSYKLCYKFYVYMYPSLADSSLLMFQRHGLKNLTKYMDPLDIDQLIRDTRADFLLDRRLTMIQNQSSCFISLEPLNLTLINGLPHRLINIHSSSFENIAKALSIMEDTLPDLMQTAVFKQDLPLDIATHKWSAKRFIFRPPKHVRNYHGDFNWRERVDKGRRFPSLHHFIDKAVDFISPNRKRPITEKCHYAVEPPTLRLSKVQHKKDSHIRVPQASLPPFNQNPLSEPVIHQSIKKSLSVTVDHNNLQKSSLVQNVNIDLSNHSNVFRTTNEQTMSNSSIIIRSTSLSLFAKNKQPFHYKHIKRIKCPASVLTRGFFSDKDTYNFLAAKYQCCIVQPTATCPKTHQVKLSIMYNSITQLHNFCESLGLRMKSK